MPERAEALQQEAPQSLLRRQAYAERSQYLDQFKDSLGVPDGIDANPHATTFVAACKATGEVLGTIRIACNADIDGLLLPKPPGDPCTAGTFSFVDRFAVKRGAPAVVSFALLKTAWLWTLGCDARWIVALASPALARHYQRWAGLTIRAGGQSFIVAQDLARPVFLVAARVAESQNHLIVHNPWAVDNFLSKVHPDINAVGVRAH